MKRLILGDIHGHWDTSFDIYNKENPDSVIVLGDYFDNFHGSDESILECFDNFVELQAKHNTEKKGPFIMLIGNHDFHYMVTTEAYSGKRQSYAFAANDRLSQHFSEKKLMQFVYLDYVNKTIYSHAGVTNSWMKENAVEDIQDINMSNLNKFKFTYRGGGDCYGNTKYASPIWIRPEALLCDMYVDTDGHRWDQIVGHTHEYVCKGWSDEQSPQGFLHLMDSLPHWYLVEELDENGKLISRTPTENVL